VDSALQALVCGVDDQLDRDEVVMRVAVFGCGYVGLVTGTCLADLGHDVVCIDQDGDKIAALNRGEIPIYEPGLDLLASKARQLGRLRFVTNGQAAEAVARAVVVFIAVGTPTQAGNGHADLSYVRAVARDIAKWVSGYTVIVTKSTVPVGTGDALETLLHELRPTADVSVASNPEFLREGSAISDFQKPDRVVIGVDDARAGDVLLYLYRPLGIPEQVLVTSRRAAELVKYAANAFLAVKISFINEIADLCEKVGVDVGEVSRGIGSDRRIGPDFLRPGPGYGGSCFPKDTLALVSTAHDQRVELRIVESAVTVNDVRKRAMAQKVVEALGGSAAGCTIGVLGLAFKPNTDDMRDAPSITLIEELQRSGAQIRAFDPVSMKQAQAQLRDVAFCEDPYDCAQGTDAVVLVTDWEVLANLDLDRLHGCMNRPVFVDLWNAYDAGAMARAGFAFTGVGNGAAMSLSLPESQGEPEHVNGHCNGIQLLEGIVPLDRHRRIQVGSPHSSDHRTAVALDGGSAGRSRRTHTG
jgi:UDPglucose 6-dehydrogenase